MGGWITFKWAIRSLVVYGAIVLGVGFSGVKAFVR
jgi:hypothetical protein